MSGDDYLEQADAAFYGYVIAARIEDPELVAEGEARLAGPPTIFTVAVQEVYKGSVRARQEVVTALSGASCGAGLEIDRSYVIYARYPVEGAPEKSPLSTGLCDGTYEPDGVTTYRLDGGEQVANEPGPNRPPDGSGDWYGTPAGEPIHGPRPTAAAIGGLMLASTAVAAALIALAART